MSEYHKQIRNYMLSKFRTQGHDTPATKLTIILETFERPTLGTRRVGRQRNTWLEETLNDMWTSMQANDTNIQHIPLNITEPEHRELIKIESQNKKTALVAPQTTQKKIKKKTRRPQTSMNG